MSTAVLTGVFTLLGVLTATFSGLVVERTNRRVARRDDVLRTTRQLHLEGAEELTRLHSLGRQFLFDVQGGIPGAGPQPPPDRRAVFAAGFNAANEELKLIRVRAEAWRLVDLARKLDQARPMIQELNIALYRVQGEQLDAAARTEVKSRCDELLDALQDLAVATARS